MIMPKRSADATWKGTIGEGSGEMSYGSYEGKFSVASRFEDGEGTNPEEMIGAAHAGCFSMAFSAALTEEGFEPETIETHAEVTIEKVAEDSPDFHIPSIALKTEANIPGIDEATFQEIARAAKENCPVSKVLAGADISLEATLK
jgi:osmotically inducible protein OsmC